MNELKDIRITLAVNPIVGDGHDLAPLGKDFSRMALVALISHRCCFREARQGSIDALHIDWAMKCGAAFDTVESVASAEEQAAENKDDA